MCTSVIFKHGSIKQKYQQIFLTKVSTLKGKFFENATASGSNVSPNVWKIEHAVYFASIFNI